MVTFIGIDISTHPNHAIIAVLRAEGHKASIEARGKTLSSSSCQTGSAPLWCASLLEWCRHLNIRLPDADSLESIGDTIVRVVEVVSQGSQRVTLALDSPFCWTGAFAVEQPGGSPSPALCIHELTGAALPLSRHAKRTTDREIARITRQQVVPLSESADKLGRTALLARNIVEQLTAAEREASFALNLFGRKTNPPFPRRIIEVYPSATLYALTGTLADGDKIYCRKAAYEYFLPEHSIPKGFGKLDAVVIAYTAFLHSLHSKPDLFFKPIECELASDDEFAAIAEEGWIATPRPLPDSALRSELFSKLKVLLKEAELQPNEEIHHGKHNAPFC